MCQRFDAELEHPEEHQREVVLGRVLGGHPAEKTGQRLNVPPLAVPIPVIGGEDAQVYREPMGVEVDDDTKGSKRDEVPPAHIAHDPVQKEEIAFGARFHFFTRKDVDRHLVHFLLSGTTGAAKAEVGIVEGRNDPLQEAPEIGLPPCNPQLLHAGLEGAVLAR